MTSNRFFTNIKILYANEFLGGLEFYIPIYALYLQQELFSLFYVTLILALKSFLILILEIPTGAIADLFGRKNTLLASRISSIIAVILYFIGNLILIIIVAVFFSACASSLASGTTTSMLFESIESIEPESKPSFKKANGILFSLWPIGASISSFIGGYFSIYSLHLPFILSTVPFFIALIALIFLREPTNTKKEEFQGLTVFKQTKESLVFISRNRQLLIIFSVGFFSFAFGEVTHQLKPIFLNAKNIRIELFGLFFAFAFIFSFTGSLLSHPISEKFGNKRTLIVTFFIPVPLQILAVIFTGFISGVLVTIGSLSWGIRWPILSEMSNKEIPNKYRSTILSTTAFINNLGFVISSPLVGILLVNTNINFVYLVEALISVIILIPYFYLQDS